MQGKCCHMTLNPRFHESKRVRMSRPWIESLTVAAAAMLALSNTTNAVRCCVQDRWQRAPWHLTSSAEVMIGERRRRGGRGRTREGEDGNNRGRRQQQCLSSSNQVAIRKHKKAKKTQQSTTKMEAEGTYGCWKRRQCFVADGRGLGAG